MDGKTYGTMSINSILVYFGYFLIFFLSVYMYMTRNFNYWKNRGVPFLKPTPFIGNGLKILTFQISIAEHMRNLYFQSKEPFVGFWIGDRPYLLLRHPDILKTILIKDFNYFTDRTAAQNYRDDPLGSDILFIAKNPSWKNMRTRVRPLFSSGKIKQMFPLMYESAMDMETFLMNQVKINPEYDSKVLCKKLAVDVISTCAFGIKSKGFEYENDQLNLFAKRVFDFNWKRGIQMTCCFLMPTLFKLFRMTFLDPLAADFFDKIFMDAIKEREASKKERNDLIDILIYLKNKEKEDDPGRLGLNMIISQATQFFIAGFETTSSFISYTIFELALNPKVQEKLREEIKANVKKNNGLTYDGIQEMEYMKLVLKESLRKYPPLPFLDRVCVANYKIPDTDIVIEKGTRIFVPLMGLHYDPQYFSEPDKFIPERFLPDNITWPPNAYIPFGEGPRNCIGGRFGYLAAQVLLSVLFLKFRVEKSKKTPEKISYNPKAFLLTSECGLPVKFVPLEAE